MMCIRPGEKDDNLPILLLDHKETLTEITHRSEIVQSISGFQMGKHHVYYPEELLERLNATSIRNYGQMLGEQD